MLRASSSIERLLRAARIFSRRFVPSSRFLIVMLAIVSPMQSMIALYTMLALTPRRYCRSCPSSAEGIERRSSALASGRARVGGSRRRSSKVRDELARHRLRLLEEEDVRAALD